MYRNPEKISALAKGALAMKIFYSWQVDAPRKVNKDFIFDALNDAINEISAESKVSESEREGLKIDQDTQGVLGSPEVARVIFDKIAASDIVVTDVSLVASGKGEKRHINSNVAIELGFAYAKPGDEAVLKIMNTYFGTPEQLPFDLRIRRHPVKYHLEPGSDAKSLAKAQKDLVQQLVGILNLYLQNPVIEPMAAHVETPSTRLKGMFWEPSEPLVPSNGRRQSHDVFFNAVRVLYFRCIPISALPELSSREAEDATAKLMPLLSEGGYSRTRNKWGAASHCVAHDGELMGMTQVFRNREIWGIDAYYSSITNNPEDDDEEYFAYLPTGAIQREYIRSINSIRRLASELGYGDQYIVEMGFSGADGVQLARSRAYFETFVGPIYQSEVNLRKTITADYPTEMIMNDFWELLFSEAGSSVPEELVWMPEDR
ncbi:hypothetical protein JQV33_09810 [Sulfitobacter mediterraneus]|nr:hypothetical protein [Sulfitobacter mediterraneus]MBM1701509.1 hypothetical protein [Sulfitobacter mediterraneus]